MEPKKVFDDMNKESTLSGKAISWLLTLLLAAILGMFGFMWQISKDIAVLKDHDDQRWNMITKMQDDIQQLRNDMSTLKTNDAMRNVQLTELKEQINEKNKR